ncbi:MAG: AAA family ATPase [Anaerolineales bacterium]|nr:MAG: AAA family ATPase [Anaerolineales bacterium]
MQDQDTAAQPASEDDAIVFPDWPLEPVQSTAADEAAAEVLGALIQHGYRPNYPPDLLPGWQTAYDAVCEVLDTDFRTRFQAFTEAINDDEDFVLKLNLVNEAMPEGVDRTHQTRESYSADELMAAPPTIQWAIPNLFPRPSLNFLIGQPGAKKTYLATDLAACLALGKPWLNHPTNQSHVLFIDEETGLYQLWNRFAAALKAHNAPWGLPLHAVSLGGFDLRNVADAERLTHRALSHQTGFIIIDALANLMRGATDSSLAAVQPVLFRLRRLAEQTQAAVLVLHHANKEGDFRGSSGIAASADLMLMAHSEPTSNYVELRTLKARFFAPPPFAARADFTPAPDGSSRVIFHPTELQAEPSVFASEQKRAKQPPSVGVLGAKPSAALSILTYLSQHPTATRQAITKALPAFSQATVRNTLQRLKRTALIKRTNGQRKGAEAVYALQD